MRNDASGFPLAYPGDSPEHQLIWFKAEPIALRPYRALDCAPHRSGRPTILWLRILNGRAWRKSAFATPSRRIVIPLRRHGNESKARESPSLSSAEEALKFSLQVVEHPLRLLSIISRELDPGSAMRTNPNGARPHFVQLLPKGSFAVGAVEIVFQFHIAPALWTIMNRLSREMFR